MACSRCSDIMWCIALIVALWGAVKFILTAMEKGLTESSSSSSNSHALLSLAQPCCLVKLVSVAEQCGQHSRRARHGCPRISALSLEVAVSNSCRTKWFFSSTWFKNISTISLRFFRCLRDHEALLDMLDMTCWTYLYCSFVRAFRWNAALPVQPTEKSLNTSAPPLETAAERDQVLRTRTTKPGHDIEIH